MKVIGNKSRSIPNVGDIEIGKVYDLPKKLADQLIKQKIVIDAAGAPVKKELTKLEKVVNAIIELAKDDSKKAFTDDGKPYADVLSNICGFDVSAKLRDQAFNHYNSKGDQS